MNYQILHPVMLNAMAKYPRDGFVMTPEQRNEWRWNVIKEIQKTHDFKQVLEENIAMNE
jgi:hypothetical protein